MSSTSDDAYVYQGPINIDRRTQLLEYGETLPQKECLYTVTYYQGQYFNIDWSDLQIRAWNDAAALVIMYDYLNAVLRVPCPSDAYDFHMDPGTTVADHVQEQFDNDSLWLTRRNDILTLELGDFEPASLGLKPPRK